MARHSGQLPGARSVKPTATGTSRAMSIQ
jgi:hypothetical protein